MADTGERFVQAVGIPGLADGALDGLIKIVYQVVCIFKPYRNSDGGGGDAGGRELLVGKLTVRGGSRMDNQRAHITYIGDIHKNAKPFNKTSADFPPTFEPKSENAAAAEWQILFY